jgi:chromosome segregation ATPase
VSAKQGELVSESSRLGSTIDRLKSEGDQLTKRLEQVRKEVIDWELRRDTAKADFQKADADLSAARKLLQEVSAKQGELVSESSRLGSTIEQLKQAIAELEQKRGRLEGQQLKSPTAGQ